MMSRCTLQISEHKDKTHASVHVDSQTLNMYAHDGRTLINVYVVGYVHAVRFGYGCTQIARM